MSLQTETWFPLPGTVSAIVLSYADSDPMKMFLCKETEVDIGLKMARITRNVCFDFQQVEKAFNRTIALGSKLGCNKEQMLGPVNSWTQPTYHVYSRLPRFPAVNINLFDFIENHAQQAEPLSRVRVLFNDYSVIRNPSVRETVLVEENLACTIRTV